MGWTIRYRKSIQKSVEKLDRTTQERIRKFLEDRLTSLEGPRQIGKSLTGPGLGSFWCYRVGHYRIVCEIMDSELIVLVIDIDHRSSVYR